MRLRKSHRRCCLMLALASVVFFTHQYLTSETSNNCIEAPLDSFEQKNIVEELHIGIGELTREGHSLHQVVSLEDQFFDSPDDSLAKAIHQLPLLQDRVFNITIWTQDYAVGYVNDIKLLLQEYGVKFIDKSLSSHCSSFGTCASGLPIIRPYNGFDIPANLVESFVNASTSNAEILKADAFLCFFPVAMCELFTTFKKPILIVTASRFNAGRSGATRWRHWRNTMLQLHKDPSHLIAATNQYDIEHINYYTKIRPQLLQPYISYLQAIYNPTTNIVLFMTGSKRKVISNFFLRLNVTMHGMPYNVRLFDDLYPKYTAAYASRHPVIVYIPHLVSSQRFMELYRMNIPLFVPSLSLLVTWQVRARIIIDRSLQPGGAQKDDGKIKGVLSLPDPEDNTGTSSTGFWLQYLDYYNMPGIGQFHSHKHLKQQLDVFAQNPQTLREISSKMEAYNYQMKRDIKVQWEDILSTIESQRQNKYF